MTYDELLHCLRAVSDVTGETELYIFGSQSVLLMFPEQSLPVEALLSREADIATQNNMEENSYIISHTFWEGSDFHEAFGLEIDGVQFDEMSLPANWESRLVEWRYEVADDFT